jgi:hypothetical protein
MSANRKSYPKSRQRAHAGPSTCPERAMMLMPPVIVTCGPADWPPSERLMGLQSAAGTAVQLAAEIGRIPEYVKSHASDWSRRLLDYLRTNAAVLPHQ